MPVYTPATVSNLEFSTNNGTTYVSVNFMDASSVEIAEQPVKQAIQSGKSVTAMKRVAVKGTLFDHDATVKGALLTAESAFTEVRWRLTLKSGNTVITNQAPISIGETFKAADGLLGFTFESDYEVPVGTAATTKAIT
jgi:hypothetical protein